MADRTHIEWTATVNPDGTVTPGATWNPTTGCTKVSPGCAHCYIDTTPAFRIAKRKFEKGNIPIILHENRLLQPLHWAKPRRIFVNSLSDLFHEDIPFEFIDRVFAVMALTPQHTYQVLTKRPARMREYMGDGQYMGTRHVAVMDQVIGLDMERYAVPWPLPNVWLGVTVENQRFADERIPILLDTPAAVRFLSCEPLLGAVTFQPDWLVPDAAISMTPGAAPSNEFAAAMREVMKAAGRTIGWAGIDWVIVGGESGPKARPTDIEHIRGIVRQCQASGVPVFVKQLGAKPYSVGDIGPGTFRPPLGYKKDYPDENGRFWFQLNDRKGGDPAEWPEDLRIREFPGARP